MNGKQAKRLRKHSRLLNASYQDIKADWAAKSPEERERTVKAFAELERQIAYANQASLTEALRVSGYDVPRRAT